MALKNGGAQSKKYNISESRLCECVLFDVNQTEWRGSGVCGGLGGCEGKVAEVTRERVLLE